MNLARYRHSHAGALVKQCELWAVAAFRAVTVLGCSAPKYYTPNC